MVTKRPPLRYDVFVAPEAVFNGPPPRVVNAETPAWDPKTATLIFGARDAVLVDAMLTIREASALADWIELHDRRLTTIYITHAHADHYLGLSPLLERFSQARAVASASTVELMKKDATGSLESFRGLFPGQVSDKLYLPQPLDTAEFQLEGRPLVVVEAGHTDGLYTTSLHVPDLGLIVSGDVAYNHCHMFLGGTTAESRVEWIAALDRLAALSPTDVVTGHKDPTQGNPPTVIGESRAYIEFYGKQREAGLSDQELFDAMVTRYPDWVGRQEFLILPGYFSRTEA